MLDNFILKTIANKQQYVFESVISKTTLIQEQNLSSIIRDL